MTVNYSVGRGGIGGYRHLVIGKNSAVGCGLLIKIMLKIKIVVFCLHHRIAYPRVHFYPAHHIAVLLV